MNVIKEKLFHILGLCERAGKLVSGETACESAIRSKKAKLVIVSKDASVNTVKKFTNMCNSNKVSMISSGCKENLGKSIGKSDRSIIAVMDEAFMKMIIDELEYSHNSIDAKYQQGVNHE